MHTPWPDPRFRRLTPRMLASFSADDVGAAVVQHVRFHLTGRTDWEVEVLRMLPAGIRAIYTTWLVDAAVNDGGFARFFLAPESRHAGEALVGYELMGAEVYASVMRAAIASYTAEGDALVRQLDARASGAEPDDLSGARVLLPELAELDQRYYALGDEIYNIWAGVVRHRPELFE